jgi:hypothetical protein
LKAEHWLQGKQKPTLEARYDAMKGWDIVEDGRIAEVIKLHRRVRSREP